MHMIFSSSFLFLGNRGYVQYIAKLWICNCGLINHKHIVVERRKIMSVNADGKVPFYKKKWFIVLIVIVVIAVVAAAAGGSGDSDKTANNQTATTESTQQNNSEAEKEEANLTKGQENALKAAETYLSTVPFSKSGLID